MYLLLLLFALGIVVGSEWLPTTFFFPLVAVCGCAIVAAVFVRRYKNVGIALAVGAAAALYALNERRALDVVWPHGVASYEGEVVSPTVGNYADVRVEGCKVRLYTREELPEGQHIRFRARMTPTGAHKSLDTFNFSRYLFHHGYAATGWASGAITRLPAPEEASTWRASLARHLSALRASANTLIEHCPLPEAQRGVLKAMTLGLRGDLDDAHTTLYRRAGASHLLALSGLHLGVLTGLLMLLFVSRLRFTVFRLPITLVLLLAIWAYVFMAGMPNSLLRAATMTSLVLLGRLVWRSASLGHALAGAALALLLCSPFTLFDVGFQLSFVAVGSMAVLLPPLGKMTEEWHPLVRGVMSLFAVSLAAWLGTMPLAAYYFHSLQPWSPLLSLIFVPSTTLLIYMTLPMMVCVAFGGMALGATIGTGVEWLFAVQWRAMKWAATLPGTIDDTLFLSPLALGLLYGVLALVAVAVYVRRLRRMCVGLAVLSLAVLPVADHCARRPEPQFVVYDNYRCPAAHFILSTDSSYLFTPRADSLWHYMHHIECNYWAYHGLATPRLASAPQGLARLAGRTLLQVHDARWTATREAIRVDYLHLLRGFTSSLRTLAFVRPRVVILDASIARRRAAFYRAQCDSLHWAVWDVREQGAFVENLSR